ncbi:MAG: DUF362 domain-containing protein [Candidatus Omnitrophota bacterium]|nr:DUF362 domain-containing protein [Candidatus Omnitrophota bacterium]MBU1928593.1 DUF362 domain-containing protein [Candidatus Omnitrophota bacterium]MBU2034606.1 DUF362 domain-containing protein [Candidatus Omnitrophota bacterium]MBU2221977.1 DUF362 domain-containing protein [Candidatus Omnitrophota bacterium]MBU2258691.1 DUF362 domain-containing protein [Candidatus Omnitrophota bacterium]
MQSKVAIVRCDSYESSLVCDAVRKSIDLLGGISDFIKPGSRVLVKPNLLSAKIPETGITTHPEVVRAVLRVLKEISCQVFVGDSPSAMENSLEKIDNVYEKTGIKQVCSQEGVELVRFDTQRWRNKFPLTSWLDKCDYLVNIPKFKTHQLTILTGAIKNLFGLIPGIYKIELHKKNFDPQIFSSMLVDIFQEAKPALNIIDAVTAMEGDGPGTSGKLRNLNLILASNDAVAVDSVLAKIMGVAPHLVLTNKEAAKRLLGSIELKDIAIAGEKLNEVIKKPFILPASSFKEKVKYPLVKMAIKFIKYYPYTINENCTRCLACIQVCPEKVISLKNNRIHYNYKGCISCFCCQETCPFNAIRVKKSLLARLLG